MHFAECLDFKEGALRHPWFVPFAHLQVFQWGAAVPQPATGIEEASAPSGEALDKTANSNLLLYILNVVKSFSLNPVKVVVELCWSSWRSSESGMQAILPFQGAMHAFKQIAEVFMCGVGVLPTVSNWGSTRIIGKDDRKAFLLYFRLWGSGRRNWGSCWEGTHTQIP